MLLLCTKLIDMILVRFVGVSRPFIVVNALGVPPFFFVVVYSEYPLPLCAPITVESIPVGQSVRSWVVMRYSVYKRYKNHAQNKKYQ